MNFPWIAGELQQNHISTDEITQQDVVDVALDKTVTISGEITSELSLNYVLAFLVNKILVRWYNDLRCLEEVAFVTSEMLTNFSVNYKRIAF